MSDVNANPGSTNPGNVTPGNNPHSPTQPLVAIAGASGFVGTHLIERLRARYNLVALGRSVPRSAHVPAAEAATSATAHGYSATAADCFFHKSAESVAEGHTLKFGHESANGVAPQSKQAQQAQQAQSPKELTWRPTELFSAQSTRNALKGVDVAIYLVHSMMPSSRLFQGSFHDTDLLLADNFARACIANGVKQIIYLGGLAPQGLISEHLQSRKEVEGVFQSTGIPTTVLRAGMIVGPGGSSFEILRSLVEKLPVMILPKWTQQHTQAVFIDDVVNVLAASIQNPDFSEKTLDLVNGESLTYKILLTRMASALALKRVMIPVPIASTGFSKRWVQLFGNSSYELVAPLIDSLLCDLPQIQPTMPIAPLITFSDFESMVRETLKREKREKRDLTQEAQTTSIKGSALGPEKVNTKRSSCKSARAQRPKRKILVERNVRSIQRLPTVPQRDCHWIAHQYMRWLPRFLTTLLRVKRTGHANHIEIRLKFLPLPLLTLQYVEGDFDHERKKFHIIGGLLTRTRDTGWLEFRQVDRKKYTLAAIHDFVPALPWPIYIFTQAPLHKWAMRSFGRYLERATFSNQADSDDMKLSSIARRRI